jgi:hypothetical protein
MILGIVATCAIVVIAITMVFIAIDSNRQAVETRRERILLATLNLDVESLCTAVETTVPLSGGGSCIGDYNTGPVHPNP